MDIAFFCAPLIYQQFLFVTFILHKSDFGGDIEEGEEF